MLSLCWLLRAQTLDFESFLAAANPNGHVEPFPGCYKRCYKPNHSCYKPKLLEAQPQLLQTQDAQFTLFPSCYNHKHSCYKPKLLETQPQLLQNLNATHPTTAATKTITVATNTVTSPTTAATNQPARSPTTAATNPKCSIYIVSQLLQSQAQLLQTQNSSWLPAATITNTAARNPKCYTPNHSC